MKTISTVVKTTNPNTIAGRLRTACATRSLALLLLLTLPAVAQAQYNYTTNNGAITITRWTGYGGSVTIPSTITGLPVTSIGDYAFASNYLYSVWIPDSVTSIGDWAFDDCDVGIVTIGNSVTNIGDYAFFLCTSLTSVTIGSKVTSIGYGAFQACISLTNVTIPNSVTNIERDAFLDCIGLSSVTIGSKVASIGDSAFEYCTNLTSLTIGTNVTSIGSEAFYECTSLTNVTIPNSVTNIGSYAFSDCTSLTTLTIGTNVTSIGYAAFDSCTSLTSVTIPASVTNIGYSGYLTFGFCTSLTAITVDPNNPVYSSVAGVLFDESQTTLIQCPEGKAGSYAVPNSVTSIGDWAFSDCTSLTSVTIPASVTSIGRGSFDGCVSVTAITVDPNNPVYSSVDGVLFDERQTVLIQYPGGNQARSYIVPNSVTSIGGWVFSACSSLTSVTIPASVTYIGEYAFSGCASLTGIYFQGNAPSTETSTFDYNSASVYYLPGTTGWGSTFGGLPTVLWLPQVQNLGVHTNQFGFKIAWASGQVVVVEACTDLGNPNWSPVGTNTLTDGSSSFSDPQWNNYPCRFYRLRAR